MKYYHYHLTAVYWTEDYPKSIIFINKSLQVVDWKQLGLSIINDQVFIEFIAQLK